MIARKLRSYLSGIAAIQHALSAPRWGVRIRVGVIPQGMPLPYVRLAEIGGGPDYHLAGEIGDLAKSVQVDVWAESEQEADQISELIRLAPLSGFRGEWSDEGGAVEVQAVTIESETGTVEDPKDGTDDTRHRRTTTYMIHHQRPVFS